MIEHGDQLDALGSPPVRFAGRERLRRHFVLWYVYLALASDSFLTERNLFTVLRQASIVSLVAIGEMMVLLVSADISEVLGLAHRVLVMCAGRVVAELDGDPARREEVLRQAVGTQPYARRGLT